MLSLHANCGSDDFELHSILLGELLNGPAESGVGLERNRASPEARGNDREVTDIGADVDEDVPWRQPLEQMFGEQWLVAKRVAVKELVDRRVIGDIELKRSGSYLHRAIDATRTA